MVNCELTNEDCLITIHLSLVTIHDNYFLAAMRFLFSTMQTRWGMMTLTPL